MCFDSEQDQSDPLSLQYTINLNVLISVPALN